MEYRSDNATTAETKPDALDLMLQSIDKRLDRLYEGVSPQPEWDADDMEFVAAITRRLEASRERAKRSPAQA